MLICIKKEEEKKCMTRFHQKFDLVPKLSLRLQLEGLSINKKYINKKYITFSSAFQQRELYLNAFHPFCYVLDGLQCRIGDALSLLNYITFFKGWLANPSL